MWKFVGFTRSKLSNAVFFMIPVIPQFEPAYLDNGRVSEAQ